jgi:hypothetical protein
VLLSESIPTSYNVKLQAICHFADTFVDVATITEVELVEKSSRTLILLLLKFWYLEGF